MINSTQPHPGTPTPPPLPRLPLDPPCPALSLPLNSPYLLLPSVHFLLGLPSPPFVSSLRDLFDQFPWMTRTALLSVYTLLFLPAFPHRGSFSAAQIRKRDRGETVSGVLTLDGRDVLMRGRFQARNRCRLLIRPFHFSTPRTEDPS